MNKEIWIYFADDADILVVGNKTDKLTANTNFVPTKVKGVIGSMYVSALTGQGITGLKQMILCSKSQLTFGHITEPGLHPKVCIRNADCHDYVSTHYKSGTIMVVHTSFVNLLKGGWMGRNSTHGSRVPGFYPPLHCESHWTTQYWLLVWLLIPSLLVNL